jgi:hypothetical protein
MGKRGNPQKKPKKEILLRGPLGNPLLRGMQRTINECDVDMSLKCVHGPSKPGTVPSCPGNAKLSRKALSKLKAQNSNLFIETWQKRCASFVLEASKQRLKMTPQVG